MKFQSLVSNIENLEVVPGTAHSSAITDLTSFEKVVQSMESECVPGTAHSSAITNIDLFEELIDQSTESK